MGNELFQSTGRYIYLKLFNINVFIVFLFLFLSLYGEHKYNFIEQIFGHYLLSNNVGREKIGRIWEKEKKNLLTLRERLMNRKASGRLKPILLQGDKEVFYGKVIEVMDILKELAIDKLGLVLKPRQR